MKGEETCMLAGIDLVAREESKRKERSKFHSSINQPSYREELLFIRKISEENPY